MPHENMNKGKEFMCRVLSRYWGIGDWRVHGRIRFRYNRLCHAGLVCSYDMNISYVHYWQEVEARVNLFIHDLIMQYVSFHLFACLLQEGEYWGCWGMRDFPQGTRGGGLGISCAFSVHMYESYSGDSGTVWCWVGVYDWAFGVSTICCCFVHMIWALHSPLTYLLSPHLYSLP